MASKERKPTAPKKSRRRTFEDKWGAEVAGMGFTMVPSLLFKAQHRLGLSPTQLVVLLQLADHWWDLDRNPWPAKDLLSAKIGINPRQIQRVVAELEKAGYVKREERYLPKGGKTSNGYDLRGLARALQKLAPDFKRIEDEVKSKRRAVVRRGYREAPAETPA